MILDATPTLRILTTVRDQFHALRTRVPNGDVAVRESFAEAVDVFDDGIVAELRALNHRAAMGP